MVQARRDARLLRKILALAPPTGVARSAWKRYLQNEVRPLVVPVLKDLRQPIEGPVASGKDLEPVKASREATPARPRVLPSERRRLAIAALEETIDADWTHLSEYGSSPEDEKIRRAELERFTGLYIALDICRGRPT